MGDDLAVPGNSNGRNTGIYARWWILTWCNFPGDWKQRIQSSFQRYAGQVEKSHETEMVHIQIAVAGKREAGGVREKCTMGDIKRLLGDNAIHCEVAKRSKAAIIYCTKEDTRFGEQLISGQSGNVRDPLDGVDLYPWQETVLEIINEAPSNRTIYWFWENEGNTGKTSLAKHICLTQRAMYVSGKASDIKYGVAALVKKGMPPKVILVDVPRTYEQFVSYEGMEAVKNGIFYSTKYESEMVMYDPPHVVCFANFHPDMDKLSRDRWDIRVITTP